MHVSAVIDPKLGSYTVSALKHISWVEMEREIEATFQYFMNFDQMPFRLQGISVVCLIARKKQFIHSHVCVWVGKSLWWHLLRAPPSRHSACASATASRWRRCRQRRTTSGWKTETRVRTRAAWGRTAPPLRSALSLLRAAASVSPPPGVTAAAAAALLVQVSPELLQQIRDSVLQKTVDGMKEEGTPYVGKCSVPSHWGGFHSLHLSKSAEMKKKICFSEVKVSN